MRSSLWQPHPVDRYRKNRITGNVEPELFTEVHWQLGRQRAEPASARSTTPEPSATTAARWVLSERF